MRHPTVRTLKAGAAYFVLAFGAGFVLGAIRVTFMVPRFGERVAELVEMPFMLLSIVFAAGFVIRRFTLPSAILVRLSTGLLALGLLLAAELLLAVMLQDRSLGDYIASRDPVSGSVYLAMLALFAAMPALVARARNSTSTEKGQT